MKLFPWLDMPEDMQKATRELLSTTGTCLEFALTNGPEDRQNFVSITYDYHGDGPTRILVWGDPKYIETKSPSPSYVPRGVWR